MLIVAKNIPKYCIGASIRINLRPLKSPSRLKDLTGREVGLQPTQSAAAIAHAAAAEAL